jgi:serine/threonine-protein kinase RsbW
MNDVGAVEPGLKGSVVHLRITSRREFLDPVHDLAEQLIAKVGFSEDESYWMVTAVREAVTNALMHGNQERPGTHVEVEFELLPGGIRITVKDEGSGFDPTALPDPVSKEHLMNSSGRGVYLMQQLMDEVTFEFPATGGTTLTMVKLLETSAGS